MAVWYVPNFQSGGCGFESRPMGYLAPRSTQPSIPPGSVNEYQLRLGRQRQVWIPERVVIFRKFNVKNDAVL